MSPISVSEPLTKAWNRMVWILFKPFDIGKWFILGFTAWLAMLAEGCGFNFNFDASMFDTGSGGSGGSGTPPWNHGSWDYDGVEPVTPEPVSIMDNLDAAMSSLPAWAMILIVAIIPIILIISIVLMWIRSRGKFMFIDNIAQNRSEVVWPWGEYAAEGNNLFKIDLILTALLLVVLGLIGVLGYVLLYDFMHTPGATMQGQDIATVVTLALLAVGAALLYGFIRWVLTALVVPVMYARRVRVLEAWQMTRAEIIRNNLGNVVLFFLLQIALGFGAALIATIAVCCTCFLAALPYIGTVILLPIFVFMQSFLLYFIDQYGGPYRIMVEPEDLDPYAQAGGDDPYDSNPTPDDDLNPPLDNYPPPVPPHQP